MSVKQILIVEKDALQAYLLEAKLGESGWGVRLVESPETALLCCEKEAFDAAIINYKYDSEINGLRLAHLLRERHRLPSLMITAIRRKDLEKDPWFSNYQALLFKPYRLLECSPRLKEIIPESWN